MFYNIYKLKVTINNSIHEWVCCAGYGVPDKNPKVTGKAIITKGRNGKIHIN